MDYTEAYYNNHEVESEDSEVEELEFKVSQIQDVTLTLNKETNLHNQIIGEIMHEQGKIASKMKNFTDSLGVSERGILKA